MYEISGCRITSEQMKLWRGAFLPLREPFYIDGNQDQELLDHLRSSGLPVYSRVQFSEIASRFIGEYGANYNHWGVPATASIAFFEASRLSDSPLRSGLFAHQAVVGRG